MTMSKSRIFRMQILDFLYTICYTVKREWMDVLDPSGVYMSLQCNLPMKSL